MFVPGRSLRTNDTVVRDTPARAATSALVGLLRETANSAPKTEPDHLGSLLQGLGPSDTEGELTRVSDAY
jgi:hypothetical protein